MAWNGCDGIETIGESIDTIQIKLNTIAGGGWSVAANAQIAELFNAFDFGTSFDANKATKLEAFTPNVIGYEGGPDPNIIDMFGDTFKASGRSQDYGGGGLLRERLTTVPILMLIIFIMQLSFQTYRPPVTVPTLGVMHIELATLKPTRDVAPSMTPPSGAPCAPAHVRYPNHPY